MYVFVYSSAKYYCFSWCACQDAVQCNSPLCDVTLYCSCYFLLFQQSPIDLFLTFLEAESPLAAAAGGMET